MGSLEIKGQPICDYVHVANQSLQHFIESLKKTRDAGYLDGHPIELQWDKILSQQGYYHCLLGKNNLQDKWQEVHAWCEQQYTKDRYAWTGSVFWFETEQDQILFALKWS